MKNKQEENVERKSQNSIISNSILASDSIIDLDTENERNIYPSIYYLFNPNYSNLHDKTNEINDDH